MNIYGNKRFLYWQGEEEPGFIKVLEFDYDTLKETRYHYDDTITVAGYSSKIKMDDEINDVLQNSYDDEWTEVSGEEAFLYVL